MKMRAIPIAYSSVVGAGIMLRPEHGPGFAQLAIMGQADGLTREGAEALRDRLVAAINAYQPDEQVRHFKTGVAYDVVDAHALFQVSEAVAGIRHVRDGDPVTVYRNPEGMHFVRFPDEMTSPRFEKV